MFNPYSGDPANQAAGQPGHAEFDRQYEEHLASVTTSLLLAAQEAGVRMPESLAGYTESQDAPQLLYEYMGGELEPGEGELYYALGELAEAAASMGEPGAEAFLELATESRNDAFAAVLGLSEEDYTTEDKDRFIRFANGYFDGYLTPLEFQDEDDVTLFLIERETKSDSRVDAMDKRSALTEALGERLLSELHAKGASGPDLREQALAASRAVLLVGGIFASMILHGDEGSGGPGSYDLAVEKARQIGFGEEQELALAALGVDESRLKRLAGVAAMSLIRLGATD